MRIGWEALLLGFTVGVSASMLFFAGLAWGMRLALRSVRPGPVLLLSSLCRIAVLLGVGFWVTAIGDKVWSLVGYAVGFFLVRLAAVLWARTARIPGQAEREGV